MDKFINEQNLQHNISKVRILWMSFMLYVEKKDVPFC